jgi:hypothetical protein
MALIVVSSSSTSFIVFENVQNELRVDITEIFSLSTRIEIRHAKR